MIYEISNPSDCITIEADDELVACVAVLLLGSGKYGLVRQDGATVLSIFLLGGADAWIAERVGDNLDEWIEAHSTELATVLDTAMVVSVGLRAPLLKAIAAAGGDRQGALAAFNEERRTSMNDICGRARRLAARLREPAEAPTC